jgi:hypothetical protein
MNGRRHLKDLGLDADDIEMDMKEKSCDDVNCIYLSQDKVQ